jgi:hypothetical protein
MRFRRLGHACVHALELDRLDFQIEVGASRERAPTRRRRIAINWRTSRASTSTSGWWLSEPRVTLFRGDSPLDTDPWWVEHGERVREMQT